MVITSGLAVASPVQSVALNADRLALLQLGHVPVPEAAFRNVILMIGDGMGFGQLNATRKWLGTPLLLDSFPWNTSVDTYSLNSAITDSAAAATALATGERTNNYVVSMTPAGAILGTVLELAESLNKSTGLVTTTRVSHATPAAFAAHVSNRNEESEIARQILEEHDVEVLLGGGMSILSPYLSYAQGKGYVLAEDRDALLNATMADRLLGVFASGFMSYNAVRDPLVEPHIREMTNVSLQILSRDAEGFFLMVEGGLIDQAGHANNISYVINETQAFDDAVAVALEFAQTDGETLVIVCADHETGGLWVNSTSPELDYQWSTTGHTGAKIPVFAYCANLSVLPAFGHLTDIGDFLWEALGFVPEPPVWTRTPTDCIVEFGESYAYDLDVTTSVGVDMWWTNDSFLFSIDVAGVVRNASALSVGAYGLQVWVNDTLGRTLSAAFAVLVQDTTPPSWIVAPVDQLLDAGEPLDLQLAAWDLAGIDHWIVNDTTHFAISGAGRLTNATTLIPGSYGVAVEVYDLHSNMIGGTFRITIQQATTTGPTEPAPIDPWILATLVAVIGLSVGVGAGVLLVRYRRTRKA